MGIVLKGKTQINLVSNGSFENYSFCPTGFASISTSTGWYSPSNSTPDYFNRCYTFSDHFADVPLDCLTYQEAKTGDAYAGIYIYDYNASDTVNTTSEYIQTQLTQTLSAGTCYYFEMYYNLSNFSGYGSNRLQVLISTTQFTANYTQHFNNLSTQIELDSTTYITDTLNWVKLSGTIIATGGEKYVTIGNFKDKAHTKRINLLTNFTCPCGSVSNNLCYINIDDVSLYDCSSIGLKENSKENHLKVYPNPAENQLFFDSNTNNSLRVKLYNMMGSLVAEQHIENGQALNTAELAEGIYTYKIYQNDTEQKIGKVLISH